MHVEIATCTNTVYYTYSYVAIKDQFVTGFAKRGHPNTSDLQASSFRWLKGMDLQIVQFRVLP